MAIELVRAHKMKPILILLIVSFTNCGVDHLLAQSDEKALDANQRMLVNAYVGALKLRDWEFIYENSSSDFQTQICLQLFAAAELTGNEKLSALVDKNIDKEKLGQHWETINSTFSPAHKTRLFDQCVRDKKELFLNGLRALEPDQLPSALRLPDKVCSISKRVDGYIKIELHHVEVLIDSSKDKWIYRIVD